MNDLTIPVVTVAAELGVSPDQLVARLGDAVLTDAIGLRCVERPTAAALIDEHRAAQAEARRRDDQCRARAAERRADMAQRSQALHDQVQAIQEHQRQLRESGVIDDETPALVAMAVGDRNPRLEAAGRRMDAWLQGRSEGASISPRKD